MTHTMKFLGAVLVILLSTLVRAQTPPQAPTPPQPEARAGAPAVAPTEDRWYEVWIEGSRSGWMHETVTIAEDLVTTRSQMQIAIRRADQTLEIRQESEFRETPDGKPVRMSVEQQYGPVPITSVYEFHEDEVILHSAQGDQERQVTMPLPKGEWLPPAATSSYVRQRLLSGATEITVRTLDPSNGLTIATITRDSIEPAEVEVLGKTVKGYRASGVTKVAAIAVPSVEWFNAEGTLLRSETSLGAMKMVLVASTRAQATMKADVAELMVSTFVRPERPINRPRTRQSGSYIVSLGEGALPDLVPGASQRAERIDDHTIRVTVDLAMHQAAGDVDRAADLASTTYADTNDEVITSLTAEALKSYSGKSDAIRAEALRRFVFHYIKSKDLGVAFATASETARSREGDCSEHGVLLAAMLRAAGIPSRVVAGVVYVEEFAGQRGVFGYHMWTQALLDGPNGPEWADVDATLGNPWPFDATHIAFATSDLAEGETVSALAGIAPLLGTLRIEVLD